MHQPSEKILFPGFPPFLPVILSFPAGSQRFQNRQFFRSHILIEGIQPACRQSRFRRAVKIASSADKQAVRGRSSSQFFRFLWRIFRIIAFQSPDSVRHQKRQLPPESFLRRSIFSLTSQRMRPYGNSAGPQYGTDGILSVDSAVSGMDRIYIFLIASSLFRASPLFTRIAAR